jgi:hypothetical protein
LPLVAEEDLMTFVDQERQDAGALEHVEVPQGLRAAVTERLVALSPAGSRWSMRRLSSPSPPAKPCSPRSPDWTRTTALRA